MVSLCIPTIDRYDKFLNESLTKYVKMIDDNIIDEIVITDENGNDYNKINNNNKFTKYINSGKLKIFKNEKKLGHVLNTINVCKKSKNEWIAIICSDDFADDSYFKTAMEYLKKNNVSKNSIIAPDFAKPNFSFRKYSGKILNKNNVTDDEYVKKNIKMLLNTGNYIINRSITDNVDISKEANIEHSSCVSFWYMNVLFFEQFDSQIHIVRNMEYEHRVHNGSLYLTTCNDKNNIEFRKKLENRFKTIASN